ncbi:hypothetical protein J4Q44_G00006350, partial [Coregonus suidteri]
IPAGQTLPYPGQRWANCAPPNRSPGHGRLQQSLDSSTFTYSNISYSTPHLKLSQSSLGQSIPVEKLTYHMYHPSLQACPIIFCFVSVKYPRVGNCSIVTQQIKKMFMLLSDIEDKAQ